MPTHPCLCPAPPPQLCTGLHRVYAVVLFSIGTINLQLRASCSNGLHISLQVQF